MSTSSDIVVLRTAGDSRALPMLRVFISGFACRHDLPVDRLDDVQLAVETLLVEEPEGEGEVVLEISAAACGLTLHLGGLRNQAVKAALLATDPAQPGEHCPLNVRVLLDSLVDCYRVLDMPEGLFAVQMDKRAS